MKKLIIFVLLFVSCNCYRRSKDAKKQIIGDGPADITEVPYIAQLLKYDWLICGAIIISEYWLLTAAHCSPSKLGLTIMTGSTRREIGGVTHEIEEYISHDYVTRTDDNDIALIKLKHPLVFDNAQTMIPIAKSPPVSGDTVKISGYGKTGPDMPFSQVLKSAEVQIIDYDLCVQQYHTISELTPNMFCAGNGLVDSCRGDSGGPAVVDGELVGIVASGEGCGYEGYAGVYTKVYNYLDWIREHTGLEL